MSAYVRVRRPGHPDADARGDVKLHRLVMGEWCGRVLGIREVVHHRDRDRKNNERGNLLLFASQRDHLAFHRLEDSGRPLDVYLAPVETSFEPPRRVHVPLSPAARFLRNAA